MLHVRFRGRTFPPAGNLSHIHIWHQVRDCRVVYIRTFEVSYKRSAVLVVVLRMELPASKTSFRYTTAVLLY